MSRRQARYRGGGNRFYRFTSVERDRRYQQGYVTDAKVRAKLKAGIDKFRLMLEAIHKEQVANG